MLSHSVAEISVEEEVNIMPFLYPETRVVLNENGARGTKVSSSVDILATERLSNVGNSEITLIPSK